MAQDQNPAQIQSWDWLDDDEQLKLDLDSPLVVSPSFWDGFGDCNDSVVRSLFDACSHGDDAFSPGKKDNRRAMQHKSPLGQKDNLHFTPNEPQCSSPNLSDSFEHCSSSFVKVCDDPIVNHVRSSSPSSTWSMGTAEEPYMSAATVDAVQQSTENWMFGCVDDGADSDIPEVDHRFINGKAPVVSLRQHVQGVRTVLHGKTGHASKTVNASMHRHGVKRKCEYIAATGVWKPVVFPFALVKPCGIQGDTTLKDINQRINMTSPSRSLAEPVDRISSPSIYSPLSGKSVLAVTKIHTEGKGSITIMRTKG